MADILLIEPDHITSTQFSNFLKNCGHNVVIVAQAQEGIQAADKKTPDLVILEPVLAQHSGIEFLYEFRSYDEWKEIPVIIISRLSSSELGITEKTAEDLGINLVAYKAGLSMKKISEEIEKIILAAP